MPLTATEQAYYDFAKSALPRFLFASPRVEEVLNAYAKCYGFAEVYIETIFQQTLIQYATNLPPDYLDQHARGRGTSRQDGESDESLRDRLRNISDAVTPSALFDAIKESLLAEGITADPAILELRTGKAFLTDNSFDSGTGGEFAVDGSTVTFTPDVAFQGIPSGQISFISSFYAGNDGAFDITGIDVNGVTFTNGSGVADIDPTTSWAVNRQDPQGNYISGRNDAYFSRGFRFGTSVPPTIVVMLPYGCNQSTEVAVREVLRQKKGAGVLAIVECRQVP